MDKSIRKLINALGIYLKKLNEQKTAILIKEKKKVDSPLVVDCKPELDSFLEKLKEINIIIVDIKVLKNYLENADAEPTLIANFPEMCKMLTDFNFPLNDILNIIFYIIKNNIRARITEYDYNNPILNALELDSTFPLAAAVALMSKYSYEFISQGDFSHLPLEEQIQLKKFKKALSKVILEQTPELVQAYIDLENHYFNREGLLTQNDIDHIIAAFNTLGITTDITQAFKQNLEQEITDREKREKASALEESLSKRVVSEKRIIPKKEYFALKTELDKYLDSDKLIPLRYLSLDEIIICLNLLRRLQFSLDQIIAIISKIEKFNTSCNILPSKRFADLKAKLEYYQDNAELKSSIELLALIYKEVLGITEEKEKEELEEMLKEELDYALTLIPKNYAYELSFIQEPQN